MERLIQQVNFYQPFLRPQKKPFSVMTMSVMTGIALLLMLLFWGYGYYQVTSLQDDIEQLQARQQAMKNQLEQTRASLAPRENSPLLAARQLRLEKDLQDARRLVSLLHSLTQRETHAYSAFFRGFAENTVPGLWLQQVHVSAAGQALSFAGETVQPELLPRLLQRLSGQAVFRGHHFNQVIMSRGDSDEDQRVRFELNSTRNPHNPGREQNDAG